MSRSVLSMLLPVLLFSAVPSQAFIRIPRERLFFEAGPIFLVTLDDDELDHYWGEGIGASGSIGFKLSDKVALVPTASFASLAPKGSRPIGYVGSILEAEPPILIVYPRSTGERATVIQTGLNVRLSRVEPGLHRTSTFFTVGLVHAWEDFGSRYPYGVAAEEEDGFYLSVGGGLTLDVIHRFPLAVEVLFQTPLEGHGTFLPIKGSFRF